MHYKFSETELWKDIEGYEGYYQVSSYGRVRSLSRISIMKNGVKRKKHGRILIPLLDGKKRYLHVNLAKNGKISIIQVHGLVAKAFSDGYFDGAEVDHIDTNPTNNRADNLKWTTRSGNMRNPITHQRIIRDHIERQRKAVIGVNISTGHVLRFDYIREAKRNGFKGIGENLHGRAKQCRGYVWRYADEI